MHNNTGTSSLIFPFWTLQDLYLLGVRLILDSVSCGSGFFWKLFQIIIWFRTESAQEFFSTVLWLVVCDTFIRTESFCWKGLVIISLLMIFGRKVQTNSLGITDCVFSQGFPFKKEFCLSFLPFFTWGKLHNGTPNYFHLLHGEKACPFIENIWKIYILHLLLGWTQHPYLSLQSH